MLKKRSAAKVCIRSETDASPVKSWTITQRKPPLRTRHKHGVVYCNIGFLQPCTREFCVVIFPLQLGMESTTITTTEMAPGLCSFGLSERRATITLHAPAQECALPNAEAYQSQTKVLKRQRSTSPELLRCKRRLSFNGLGYAIPQELPVAVARRNERERNRVKQVNMGFQTLRQHVPNGAANKKMSKVETLRSAVEYIRALQQLLDEHDAVSAAFQCGVPSPTISNTYSAEPESPQSTYSSDEGSCEQLSSEDQELLDFTTWFDRY